MSFIKDGSDRLVGCCCQSYSYHQIINSWDLKGKGEEVRASKSLRTENVNRKKKLASVNRNVKTAIKKEWKKNLKKKSVTKRHWSSKGTYKIIWEEAKNIRACADRNMYNLFIIFTHFFYVYIHHTAELSIRI